MKTPIAFAIVLACAAACSSQSSSQSSPTTSTVNDAINAYCSLMQRCSPVEYNRTFASSSDCVTAYTAWIGPWLSLPGVTQDELNGIVNLANTMSCTATGDPSTGTGSLANGTACAAGLQCRSGVCVTDSTGCGTCQGVALGAACSDSIPCAVPNACIDATCQAKLADGTTCTDSSQCQNNSCDFANADAFAGQVCKTETGIAEGQSCANGGQCEATLACNGTTCVQPSYVALGQACGDAVVCQGGYCDPTTSVCTEFPAAGSACSFSDSYCRFDCSQVGDSDTTGVCDVPLGTTCN